MQAPRHRPVGRLAPARVTAALLVLATLLLGPAIPAGADPARPTDFRSRIVSVRPELPAGVEMRVVGGDAFLELHVTGRHTVIVPDYSSGTGTTRRPYLRFGPGGLVERNEHSAAAAANRTRYGTTGGGTTIRSDPSWVVVARNGRYVWHDHRIHWMLPQRPTSVSEAGRVDLGGRNGTWTVGLRVDGRLVLVRGELLLLPSPSPWPWVAAATLVGLAVVGVGWFAVRARRPPPYPAIAAGLAVGALGATLVGWAQWRTIPAGAGGTPVSAAVPAIALAAALVAIRARSGRLRLITLAASAAALAGWAILRRDALRRAVLPTSLPYALDRAGTALALGLALGAAALLVWRPPTDRPAP